MKLSKTDEDIFIFLCISCGLFNFFLWYLYVLNVINLFKSFKKNNKPLNNTDENIIVNSAEQNEDITEQKEEYNIYIVRGFPGSGKSFYVYSNEYKRNKIYSVCNINEFFYKNGEYVYDYNTVENARNFAYNKFLKSIQNNINNIYVVGIFEQTWMYTNYIELGKLNGYNVQVIDMFCPDKNYLFYYNRRCRLNIPMKVSLKYFNKWEYDVNSIIQEPYLDDDLEGDCLPCYNKTKKDLDNELDDYINNRDTDQDVDSVYNRYSYNLNYSTKPIRIININTAEKISKWELTNVLKNKFNINNFNHNRNDKYIDFIKTFDSSDFEQMYIDLTNNITIFEDY